MCQLLETIRIENGEPQLIGYHQERMNCAAQELWNGIAPNLQVTLMRMDFPAEGVFKCRIVYGREIEKVEVIPYTIRNIQSLKLIEGNNIDYSHKWVDRTAINELYENRGISDDILIVKDGLITDTSYCNVVLGNDIDGWFTPENPLLDGVMRQSLIDTGEIEERAIKVEDLSRYKYIRLINAMMPWQTGPEFLTETIETAVGYDYQ
ncbi:4-amino-4-deoxychorismate lyase [Prolixibacteraceae bacterium JC049]|nr:4-amino-4-deoxychorismate lyase [Prolixibacteraceae bacterium JC049]